MDAEIMPFRRIDEEKKIIVAMAQGKEGILTCMRPAVHNCTLF